MRYITILVCLLITAAAFGQRQKIANLEIAPDSNAAWTIYTDTNGIQQYFKWDSILYDIFDIDTLGGTNNYLDAATFGTGTGTLTLGRLGLADITVSLDGRYATDNNYATGHTFNTSTGLLTTSRQGLGDISVDLDGRYATTNNYVSSTSFNTTTGDLTLNRFGLSSLTQNLDGRYSTSNNYLTGLSFNTSNGVLTATRQGLIDVTEGMDGRYLNLAAFNVGDVTGGKRISVSPTTGTYDNFELYEGANITLTRTANDITISAAGSSSNWTDNGSTLEPASGEDVYTGSSGTTSSFLGINGAQDYFLESTTSSVFTITPTQGSTGAAGFYYAPGSNFMRIGDQSGTRDNISFGGISSSTDDAGTGGADNYLYINSSGYLSSAPAGTHNVTTSSTLSDQDVVCYNTTSSATIVPQTFTSEGKMYIIINNTVGNITIDPGSSTQINGASTYTLAGNRALTIIYASGSYWTTAETPIN